MFKKENLDLKLSLLAASFANEPVELDAPLKTLINEGYNADRFPKQVLRMLEDKVQQSKMISLGECTAHNNLLQYREEIYVPDYDPLKHFILQSHHDATSAGHPGCDKTFELVSRRYYWRKMRKYIAQYTKNCKTCRRAKPTTHGKHGVLRPLPIPQQPWQQVSMDFVSGLPESQGYNAILVIVDRLSKMRHLIPCDSTVDAEQTATLYLQHVWKLHGLPTHITSDRGTQFTSRFWKSLCQQLKIEAKMSTANHPKTDGQTERVNAVIEQYLRCYVSYQQDNWASRLPMAEFAANNQEAAATNATPFFANYGFHPRFDNGIAPTDTSPQAKDAQNFPNKMAEIQDFLLTQMLSSQATYEESTNKSRTLAPAFQIGDPVFLSTKNIRTAGISRKLDGKRIGPFPVKKVVSPYAYELSLPPSIKLHPVFHILLLDPARNTPVPGQHVPPPPVTIVEDNIE